ncbi:MAG: hypothetical protein J6T72_03720 [Alphaproteobacteria bacterium]|nr:hypothetical protein [Alphaproteobacteria bacterium]
MKKIFALSLLLFFFFCSCNTNGTTTPSATSDDKEIVTATSPAEEQPPVIHDTLEKDITLEQPEIFGSKVHRVAQKNISINQGSQSIPLVLLENGEILSEDEDILYFVKPGDSVYYSSDGEITKVIFIDKKSKGRS